VNEIKTGVPIDIVEDAVARDSIAVPTLLRRLHLDERIEQARLFLRDVLAELESDEFVGGALSAELGARAVGAP
jgi:hypothetical protein